MKKPVTLLVIALIGAIASVPAFADGVVYNNTVVGTSYETSSIGIVATLNAVADSFTLLQDATVTGAMFGLWVAPGYQATSVTWAITSEPFAGTTLGSGKADVTNSIYVNTMPLGEFSSADVDQVFIALPNLALAAGPTYYLEVDGVTSNDLDSIGAYWDESDGKSTVYQELFFGGTGNVFGPSSASQTFQILGEQENVTPEPSSFLLLGSGLAGLAGLIKRKLRA
jgi:hypothetical protein